MSADLIDRLQNPDFNDLQWPKGLFAECADRIETLEAALREISDTCDNVALVDFINDALAGEKKDERN